MEMVAVEITGPFPHTKQLTAMEYFTKWPEAYAIPDQEAETVADALLEGMFSSFCTDGAIYSNQGSHFESKVFAENLHNKASPPE